MWWVTTSLERPQLPIATDLHLTPLPVTFHVTLVTGQHGQSLEIPETLQAALQADAEQAYQAGVSSNEANDVVKPLITVRAVLLCALFKDPIPCKTRFLSIMLPSWGRLYGCEAGHCARISYRDINYWLICPFD